MAAAEMNVAEEEASAVRPTDKLDRIGGAGVDRDAVDAATSNTEPATKPKDVDQAAMRAGFVWQKHRR